ncbi:dihydrodipicolinate synthase family protein [SAR202 cluster bacterium AC-647-P02_OGT_505m]|nr:dihydrodipicolinate synthase family protein [SAR202 cluster bacterium AC-647-P02_OGT_505m]
MVDAFYGMHWMLATPFMENEQVDYESIPHIIRKAKETGCTGVVGLGVMGEVARLTDDERSLIAEKIISSSDGVPVTLGTTANSTIAAIHYSKEAERLGASAVMVSAPTMAKTNLETLFSHYDRLAKEISIPIVMQDYPQTSGVEMPVDFITRVANEIPQVKYLKLEDPPTPTKISSIKSRIGDRLGIFGGLGGVFLLDELRRGSIGAMTGFAYPEVLVDICQHMKMGEISEAEELFYRHLPLIQFEQQEGIGLAIRKSGLHHRGLIKFPTVRAPAGQLAHETRSELEAVIKRVGLE